MIYKKFDQKLFNENDPKAREVVKGYFKNQRYLVSDNGQYDIDLLVGVGVEIERRPLWSGSNFPFATVNIPFRKEKFLKEARLKYFVVNNEYTYGLVIDGDEILKYPVKENKNKFVPSGELFYSVPREKFKKIEFNTNG